ncbi:unnamed protein product [Peniophora sp. CBMAI 1063]|nr:unnamed protein product [Peniophora sp. CBMAI 1063]
MDLPSSSSSQADVFLLSKTTLDRDAAIEAKIQHTIDTSSGLTTARVLQVALQTAEATSGSQTLPPPNRAEEILREHEDVEPLALLALYKRSYSKLLVRLASIHSASQFSSSTDDDSSVGASDVGIKATLESWDHPFQGTAHEALWKHIRKYSKPELIYAPYTAIVQSSGVGKTRCVDELGKQQLVIPVNLRDPKSKGFPASDESVYGYLVREWTSSIDGAIRMDAFLYSLLYHLRKVIVERYMTEGPLNAKSLPLFIHDFMSDGQTFAAQSPTRSSFYAAVVAKAEELENDVRREPIQRQGYPSMIRYPSGREGYETTRMMALRLVEACIEAGHSSRPAVVIAFDEAHHLDKVQTSTGSTPFGHLRSALCNLRGSVYSLFLSRAGKIVHFPPPHRKLDPSACITDVTLIDSPPFTAFGWDRLSIPVPESPEGIDFGDIGPGWQVFLGRPIFGSRYEATTRSGMTMTDSLGDIRRFARSTLLGIDFKEPIIPKCYLAISRQIACLAQRLPIEFSSNGHVSLGLQLEQVEHHLRVWLSIQDDPLSLVTLNPSEPILSEAASEVMRYNSGDIFAPRILSQLLSDFSISVGDRGELVGMLLLTLARDAAVQSAHQSPYQDFIPVLAFLEHLFHIPATANPLIEDIFEAKPSVYMTDTDKDESLRSTFADVSLHFNHFIKRDAQELDMQDFLMLFLRNAALLGANSRPDFDFGFMLCKGHFVASSSAGLFLVRVQNDRRCSSALAGVLFDDMDPVALGIVTPGETLHVPVIRIVMALAGAEPALTYRKSQTKGPFTAFDIFASGLDATVYGVIGEESASSWADILRASHDGWRRMYTGQDVPEVEELKMHMTPLAGNEPAFRSWRRTVSVMETD